MSADLPVYFGDAGSPAVLHSVGAERAACAVVTLDTPGENKQLAVQPPSTAHARQVHTFLFTPIVALPALRCGPIAGRPSQSWASSAQDPVCLHVAGANYRTVWALHKHYPHVKTYVRAHDVNHALNLEKAGASVVVPETLEPSLQLAAAVLSEFEVRGWSGALSPEACVAAGTTCWQ